MSSGAVQMPTVAQGPPDPNYLIFLQYGNIDTRVGEPAMSPLLHLDAYEPDEHGYYLVQFADVTLPEWRTALEATGAEPLGYVPNNAFIVRMTEAQRALVARLQPVQWIGIYQPAYRIASWMPPRGEGETTLVVLTFPGEDPEQIAAQLEGWGGEILATTENGFRGKTCVTIDLSYIPQMARLNGVMWIEPWVEPELANDVARGIMDVEDTVWNAYGLYGAGQIVAVADTGLDVGRNDASLSDDFEGRIVSAYALGRLGDWSDPKGHGTHVTGSAVGNGRNSGSDPPAHAYASSYAGIAPEAQLVHQSIMAADGSLGGIPTDLNDLFQQAYDDGARIHTNSWGAPVAGAYDHNAFDADQFVWNHPDMVVLFAAGNEGVDANADGVVDPDSVSSPGTAKNVITVGATENLRPTGGFTGRWGDGWPTRYPSNPIHDDFVSSNYNGMAAFSGRGPVDGARIKPDLVAPGTNILSVRTHQHTLSMGAESGANGWTADAPWVITTTLAHGGTHSWTTGSYDNNQDASLTSRVMDIRTGANTIGFWTRYDLGAGDAGHVEYHDGVQWQLCTQVAGTQSNWTFVSCNLPRLEDIPNPQVFRIRFRLQSDNAGTGTGWHLDDIEVTPRGWGFHDQAGMPSEHYIYMGGTSMATPLVAGTVALVREYYMGRGHVPSAALVRASLVNGTVNIAPGQYGTGATQEIPDMHPNNVAGWGRVNLQESLFPAAPQTVLYEDIVNADGLYTTQTHIYRYEVRDHTVPFRTTLVWTDYPSFPFIGKGQINNDLELLVRMPNGDLLHPNGRTDHDPNNNVEDIFLEVADVITGTYTITITGHSVPDGPQGYALVVRGGNLSLIRSLEVLQPTSIAPVSTGPYDSPHKIIMRTTKPLVGLTKTDFQIQIGAVVLSQQDVVTFLEGSEEYVFEIQPPDQPASGLYDLTVATGAYTDTEQEAVLYADTSNVDVALVLDRSGSMSGQKITDARAAAQQFVDLMVDGDMVGVVSYSSYATVNYPLTTITGTVRNDAKNAIGGISASGSTSIGDGLQTGQDQLTTSGQATHPWAMVLLSDGLENTAPYVADALPDIVASKTVVHTIGLGSGADEALMMDIAAQTGGTYHFAPSSQELAGIYNSIAGAVSGQQTLFSFTGTAQQGVTDEYDVVVDSTVSEATFSINWSSSSSDLDLTLRKPNGQIIDPTAATSDPNVDYVSGPTYEYYRVRAPTLVSGVWTMRVAGGYIPLAFRADAAADNGEPYTGLVTGHAGLTLHIYLDSPAYLSYLPVRVSVSVSDNQPITGASVTATVRRPQGTSTTITLYDDGAHDDGETDDGIYAQTYEGTSAEGTYTFLVRTSGTSNGGEPFAREKEVSVYLAANPHPPIQVVHLPLILRNYAGPGWARSGLAGHGVYSLAVHPTNCAVRYAGAENGVYKSTDTGGTWTATSLSGPLVTSVAVDPTAPQTVYATTWGQGVYKSTNGGASWSQVNSGLGGDHWMYALAIAPDGSVYVGTYDGGVYKSTSGGASWSPINNGLGNLNIRALAADPNNSQVIYAGTTAGIHKTSNGGSSWSPVSSGLPGGTVWWLTVHPTSSPTVFAGTESGLYRSINGGGSWSPRGLAGQTVYAIVIDPLDTQTLYAGTDGSGVYRSTDGGATWTAMNTGLGNPSVESLVLDGGTCHVLQAGTEDGVWTYSE
jgi:subtilisin family serine protease/photosystem II stability/assembly factor-like uncharacterized protein/uncharacterized protein YegL